MRLVRLILLVVLASGIMILSLLPEPLFSLRWISSMDKAQHWIAYTILGFLVYLSIHSGDYHRVLYVAVSIFSCTMYGGLIEVLQSFTGRVPDPIDFFVNMFGAAVGTVAALGFIETSRDSRRRGKRDPESPPN